MKRAYLSQMSRMRISFKIMFIVLMLAAAPCAQARRALCAENEPMVPLFRNEPAAVARATGYHHTSASRNGTSAENFTRHSQQGSSAEIGRGPAQRFVSKLSQWLKTGQFDEMFGPLQSSYDAIASWLTSQGFTVTSVRRDRRDVEFTGTVAQADQAFQVQIMNVSDGQHYTATSLPMIPARFQGVIFGILGLNNLLTTSPQSR